MDREQAYSLAFDLLASRNGAVEPPQQYARESLSADFRREAERLMRGWGIGFERAMAIVSVAHREQCSFLEADSLLSQMEKTGPRKYAKERYMADATGREHDEFGRFAEKKSRRKRPVSERIGANPRKALNALLNPNVSWHGLDAAEQASRVEVLADVPRRTLQRHRDDFEDGVNEERQKIEHAREAVMDTTKSDIQRSNWQESLFNHEEMLEDYEERIMAIDQALGDEEKPTRMAATEPTPTQTVSPPPASLVLWLYRGDEQEPIELPLGTVAEWEAFARWGAEQGDELARLAVEGHSDEHRGAAAIRELRQQLVGLQDLPPVASAND